MTIERIIRIMAGVMILLSLTLAHFMGQIDMSSLSWLWLTAFIGLNLLQSGFTGICPPESLLKKMGFQSGGSACSK
ncbi:MAG: rhodanese [Hydrogenophilales bacterium 28-61-23]|nr:MAG: rhodanese [Hydrogenophilales bacterium 28-61-23]